MTKSAETNRVGLLTLPLSNNYGGIVQMIALTEVLRQEGCAPVLIDKRARFRTAREHVLSLLGKIPGQNLRGARGRALVAQKHRAYFDSVIAERTAPVWTGRDIDRELARMGISTVVVGSDQVWRLGYQKDASELNYFLEFGPPGLRRVSYAASFGHGQWPASDQTQAITDRLARFDAVSVREQSGQTICRDVFNRDDAELVLDPTLLLDPEHYLSLPSVKTKPSGVLAYVLDRKDEARRLSDDIAARRGNIPVRVLSPSANDYVSIADWLSEFASAEFVVTDSFHGTIFSILFRKPFLTLLNSRRGLDRFTTLFDAFGLAGRGLTDWQGEVPEALSEDPDFDAIAPELEARRAASRAFLKAALAAPG